MHSRPGGSTADRWAERNEMKNDRMGARIIFLLSIQLIVWIIQLIFWINLLTSEYAKTDIFRYVTLILLILASIFLIIFSLFHILQGKATIDNEGIIEEMTINENGIDIEGINTKIKIKWDEVERIKENPHSVLLKNRVQLYNRGLYKIILFWYKVSAIPINQLQKSEIKKHINE